MDQQHPIPRQITSFEFKLIGFMTLRQFLYLVIFIPLGFIVYKVFPIPIINILLGVIVASIGGALAFLPVNERPLDVWIRNFIRRMTSPTQYFFLKHNPPVYLFQDLYFDADPHRVMAHIESQKKLAAYLTATKQTIPVNNKKQAIQNLIQKSTGALRPQAVKTVPAVVAVVPAAAGRQSDVSQVPVTGVKTPFFTGIVKNNKKIPLPGILVYVKDENNTAIRLLKTNPHGVFATYSPLSAGNYDFEVKDPKSLYFFDTMKIKVETNNPKPLEFYSKELL